jgi:energy-coupling factor transporter ATP-binding protein EcfA2
MSLVAKRVEDETHVRKLIESGNLAEAKLFAKMCESVIEDEWVQECHAAWLEKLREDEVKRQAAEAHRAGPEALADWFDECRLGAGDREQFALMLVRRGGGGLTEEVVRENFRCARLDRAAGIVVDWEAWRREEAEDATPEAAKAGLPAVVIQAPPLVPLVVPPSLDDALALMNSRHAILNDVGGKTVIGCWEEDDDGYFKLAFHGLDSFRLRYSNATLTIDVPNSQGGVQHVTVDLAKWWLGHRNRAQYKGVRFRPKQAGVVNGYLNLWRGWGVEPRPGDWSLIDNHIRVVIAGGVEELARYVKWWIAWAIQNPDKQAEVALVLIGEKGSGKGTLARCLKRIFGPHAMQVTDREQVIGQFNGHLEDCILFIADEAYWGGDKRCVGKLQGMITEEDLTIRRMYCGPYEAKNYLHMLMLAEPGWVIPAGRHERRYAALNVSDECLGDKAYFRALNRQMAEGGVEAMFYDLVNLDLGDWHPRDIPEALRKGKALAEQQTRTLPPWEQWYLLLLRDGKLPGAWVKKKRPSIAYTSCLIADARERVPRLKDQSDVALTDFLKEKGCEKHRASEANAWKFLPLAEARATFVQAYGLQEWDNPGGEWGDKVEEVEVEGSGG